MNRRHLCAVLAGLPLAVAVAGRAQSPPPFRIAWVTTDPKDRPLPNLEAFRAGLRELGYVEGGNVAIEVWSGEGSGERVGQMAGRIVGSRPDVVVAAGGGVLFALVGAGVKLPLVYSVSADPVEARIADSFARPGGTMTGISLFALALVGKRLELIKEILPGAKRVALVCNPQHPGEHKELAAAREGASKLGLEVRYFPTSTAATLEATLSNIARARDDAVLAFADGFTLSFAGRFAAFSTEHRIPVVGGWAQFARQGNLMTYGPVFADVYRRLAAYVDKIRKGAKPGELPIELPTKVELIVNARTAKSLGIAIPASVLARADEVIQ
jgi:putative tryptophan/tyrosine transport system substrate-binding protein